MALVFALKMRLPFEFDYILTQTQLQTRFNVEGHGASFLKLLALLYSALPPASALE